MDAHKRDRLRRGEINSEERRRMRTGGLSDEEIAELLRNAAFCRRAIAATNGVRCRLWGERALRYIDPTGRTCRHCPYGPERYTGRDAAARSAQQVGDLTPPRPEAARGHLERYIRKLGIDVKLPEAQEHIVDIIAHIRGLTEEQRLELARSLGVVE